MRGGIFAAAFLCINILKKLDKPKNAFVADFIGESNILDGVMDEDYKVAFLGRMFDCVDKRFARREVDVVIRPEDLKIVPPENAYVL